MIDYLKVGSAPDYYRHMRFFRDSMSSRRRRGLGKVVEVDLESMEVLYLIGFQRQDWDHPNYISAAERHGAKNIMRNVDPGLVGGLYRRIPRDAVVEGMDSRRFGNASVYGMNRVLRRTRVEVIRVYLKPDLHSKAHLIHPNCEIVFK